METLEIQRFEHDGVFLDYVQKGRAPGVLIHTGTHGNEFSVSASLHRWLEHNWDRMPDFLWVIAVSPSAVMMKIRLNERKKDLNRLFKLPIIDPEVAANLALIGSRHFNLGLFIHEDPDLIDQFYMYDSQNGRGSAELIEFFSKLRNHGVWPFTGIDDSDDPVLECPIIDGYYSEQEDLGRRTKFRDGDGTMMDFARRAGIVTLRRINPEFPGKASLANKDLLMSDFMEYIIKCWWG